MSTTVSEGSPVRERRALPLFRRRLSLAGKITAILLLTLTVGGGVAATVPLLPLELPAWFAFLAAVGVGLPLGAWLLARVLRPIDQTISSLTDGIRSFYDRDFSLRIATHRNDELGELARLYNAVSQTLQDERAAVREKELLLQTALDRSPAAIMLVNQRDRVIYSNLEARRLMLGGRKIEGHLFAELRDGSPPAMREILASETDGIFTVQAEDQPETYHLSQRQFHLNRRRHTLVVLRRLTGELGRQEAEIWKKVIRVISHELNNSLAPISSLVHSARVIAAEPRHRARSAEVFETLRERLDHLKGFIDGYARYARLPAPRKRRVDWREFLSGFGEYGAVDFPESAPAHEGWFDPAQIRQVLINLFKNALEASDGEPRVTLTVDAGPDGETWLQVADRGRGMDDETLRLALLPFYSTKKTGTGVGLPLCREVVEGHGGKLTLQSREGGGTVVSCWLPGAVVGGPETEAPPPVA